MKISHGKRTQILSKQQGQRIVGLSGQITIHVHEVQC